MARAERCRRSLALFIADGWHVLEPTTPLEWWWHHDAIAGGFQVTIDDWIRHRRDPTYVQRILNLDVNVPPGTLKSRIVSVYGPAWVWTKWSSWRVLCLSGNPVVALRDAVFSRQVIESDWYQATFRPDWRMSEDQDAKGNYANTAGGFRLSQGWGAKATGSRADCIIADDPNNMAEIHSETIREGVNQAWDTGWANRRNDLRTDPAIAIQQRGHERDFTGHVVAQGGWSHLVIPMEYDPTRAKPWPIGGGDPRTTPGEVLQPARFTPAVLAVERKRGSYYYAGQFQQNPAPAGGGMFKRSHWRFWKPDGVTGGDAPRPDGCWAGPARALPADLDGVLISCDAAFKGAADNDRVSFTVWGWKGADRYLLDRVTDTMSFTQTIARLRLICARWSQALKKLIEDKANGPAIIDLLRSEIQGLIPVDPQGGKEARAWACQPEIESGNVFLPDGAPWLEEYIGEFDAFPRGAHDDDVDSTTQALNHLHEPLSVADALVGFGM